MDMVIKGRILGHSASEISKDGSVKFTGIELEAENGESVWLNDASMEHQTSVIFETALGDGEPVTIWSIGNKKGSYIYAMKSGKRYAYQSKIQSKILMAALYMIFAGALLSIFVVGIPFVLYGFYLLYKGFVTYPRYSEDDVRRGDVAGSTERQPGIAPAEVMAG